MEKRNNGQKLGCMDSNVYRTYYQYIIQTKLINPARKIDVRTFEAFALTMIVNGHECISYRFCMEKKSNKSIYGEIVCLIIFHGMYYDLKTGKICSEIMRNGNFSMRIFYVWATDHRVKFASTTHDGQKTNGTSSHHKQRRRNIEKWTFCDM